MVFRFGPIREEPARFQSAVYDIGSEWMHFHQTTSETPLTHPRAQKTSESNCELH